MNIYVYLCFTEFSGEEKKKGKTPWLMFLVFSDIDVYLNLTC